MISPRILRRRIRSVQNTAKITRAMEMMAAAKMKRAQDQAIAGRPYNEKISQLIADLAAESGTDHAPHPLLERRSIVKRIAIVHITSDRGLCGGLNANINRFTGNFILKQTSPVTLVTVGKKGRDFMIRSGRDLRADFTNISDRPNVLETLPVTRVISDDYTGGLVDLVYISYTKFITTMNQVPTIEQLLPIRPSILPKTQTSEFIYEPNAHIVLEGLLPRFLEMKVYQAILEATASEHSARMVAMRSATDNANEIVDFLTLTLNKARQEMITTELLDISGGVEVLQ
jgi:F-type H+-transporting ATPase subunit gamma